MSSIINVLDNNIYICTISDLEHPNIIPQNRIVNGDYAFRSLSEGYMWYHTIDLNFDNVCDLSYTISYRTDGFLSGTYYGGETKNKEIRKLAKLLLNKKFKSLKDYHNLPILFYLHQKLDLEKHTEFKNQLIIDEYNIFNVFNDQVYIGKVVVSKKFIYNSGDQAGITMPVSNSLSKNNDIYYNGFGNYIWSRESPEEDLSQYYDDSYQEIQNVTYFKHESLNACKNEYNPDRIYVFDCETYELLRTISKDEHFIEESQDDGRYLDRGNSYSSDISDYLHLKMIKTQRLLNKIYKNYEIKPTFIIMVTDEDEQELSIEVGVDNCSSTGSLDLELNAEDPPYSIDASSEDNENLCSISVLLYCNDFHFQELQNDLFSFYLKGNKNLSMVYIDFNVQLKFRNKNEKVFHKDNQMIINKNNIKKNPYVNNCLLLIDALLLRKFKLLHAFINNAFVCVLTNGVRDKFKIELIDSTSFQYIGNVNPNYPYQLKVIKYH